jgi:hypothetical protein
MPFIGGRFYVNPIAGAAIERAREAENASSADGDDGGRDLFDGTGEARLKHGAEDAAPVRRVEIEATEIVPSHTGRAARGFVARVHRESGAAPGAGRMLSAPETHVFSDHRDLLSFLGGELGGE